MNNLVLFRPNKLKIHVFDEALGIIFWNGLKLAQTYYTMFATRYRELLQQRVSQL